MHATCLGRGSFRRLTLRSATGTARRAIRTDGAFTLLEVMIAVAIFFMAAFAVLTLVSQNLRAARSLQSAHVTAARLAAELSQTNRLEEGADSGDFGELYPGLTWTRDIRKWRETNFLFQVDYVVMRNGNPDSQMSVLLYRPEGAVGGPNVRRPGKK